MSNIRHDPVTTPRDLRQGRNAVDDRRRSGWGGSPAQNRGGHKDDKALQELPVPERFQWVPEAVRNVGPAYDVGQMWVKFAKAIRTGSNNESDFDHAVRRHRTLDAIVRASETGQRQNLA